MDRRSFVKAAAGIGLGIAAAGGLVIGQGQGALAVEESSHYRTTSALKLRTGPGTRRKVLAVMPEGAVVVNAGGRKNGFRQVSYQGTVGWAHEDYLTVSNGGSSDTPVPSGFATTTAAVNFRSEPSTSASVIRVIPRGTTVEVFDSFSGGYRMVGYAQQTGWVALDYLEADGGVPAGYLTTTSALNLRAEPSTNARVIVVMPAGTAVRATDERSNGFRRVNYQGSNGWAHDDYLA